MNDYISREAVIKELEEEIEAGNIALDEDVWTNRGLKIALKDVKAAKAADVQAVRHGRWENEYLDDDVWWADCTNCKNDTYSKYGRVSTYAYCPNCGARMDGDAE